MDEENDERKPRCTGVSAQQGVVSGRELIHHFMFFDCNRATGVFYVHIPSAIPVSAASVKNQRGEYRFPGKIPRVLLFDQRKPMTLLFST